MTVEVNEMTMKMIMDLDTGVDDALALAYALSFEEVELIGVTTSFGNVTLENATKNTINLLDLLGHSHIPVFEGASSPWGETSYEPQPHLLHIHGDNGIGNVELGEPKRQPSKQSAVDFIIESANTFGEELILYTAGPMNNLADAIKKDKEAIEKIGKIVSMGSALTVPGNVSPYAEANIHRDSNSAQYVFASDIPMTLVGLDVTLKTMIKGTDISSWHPVGTKASEAMVEMANYYYTNEFDDAEIGGAMHDPLAVEVALNPSIVSQTTKINLKVETEGEAKGRTIGNLDLLNRPYKSMTVCLDVDSELFTWRFIERVQHVLRQVD